MMTFKDLLENKIKTLVICNRNTKKVLLEKKESFSFLTSFKSLTKEELLASLTFSYKENARFYLSKHLNVPSEKIELYLNVLPYYHLNGSMTPFYSDIYEYLKTKKLIQNGLFKTLYQGYQIRSYEPLDDLIKNQLQALGFNVIDETNHNEIKTPIHLSVYETMSDEIDALFNHIGKLLLQEKDINQIEVVADETYHSMIKVYSNLYQIPCSFDCRVPLIQFDLTKVILNDLSILEGQNLDILIKIKDKLDSIRNTHPQIEELKEILFNILNGYLSSEFSFKEALNDISYTLSKRVLSSSYLTDTIKIKKSISDISSGNIIFLTGFNAGIYPKNYLDDDFLSDKEKEVLGLFTSFEKTKQEKENLIHQIENIDQLYISYKTEGEKGEAYPSFILEQLKRKKIKLQDTFDHIRFSIKKDKLNFKALSDTYFLYGISSDELKTYLKEDKLSLPRHYDSSFKGIIDDSISEKIKTLSYTKLNDYFLCGYQFYLRHILKMDQDFEVTTQLHIGNFFHDVLKDYQSIHDDVEIESRLTDYMNKNDLTHEQRFFLQESLHDLKLVMHFIKTLEERSNYLLYQTELEVSMPFSSKHTYHLLGKIDKILRHKEFNEKVYVVDYKTGNAIKPLDYLLDGFNSQLLFYLLFLKKNHFNSPYFSGFFYQNIYTPILKKEPGKTYDELKNASYKLVGYTLNDLNSIKEIDPLFDVENTLDKAKINSDGTPSKSAWVYDHNKLNHVLDDFEKLILRTIESIEANEFFINPKIAGKIDSCGNCTFRDICYLNKPKITLEKNNPFRRGDDVDTE